MSGDLEKTCECGCGQIIKPKNRFVKGHQAKKNVVVQQRTRSFVNEDATLHQDLQLVHQVVDRALAKSGNGTTVNIITIGPIQVGK